MRSSPGHHTSRAVCAATSHQPCNTEETQQRNKMSVRQDTLSVVALHLLHECRRLGSQPVHALPCHDQHMSCAPALSAESAPATPPSRPPVTHQASARDRHHLRHSLRHGHQLHGPRGSRRGCRSPQQRLQRLPATSPSAPSPWGPPGLVWGQPQAPAAGLGLLLVRLACQAVHAGDQQLQAAEIPVGGDLRDPERLGAGPAGTCRAGGAAQRSSGGWNRAAVGVSLGRKEGRAGTHTPALQNKADTL